LEGRPALYRNWSPSHCGGRTPEPALSNYKTDDEGFGAIRAIDPKTGEKEWDFKMVSYTESGVLSTAGDLVFGGGWKATSWP